jgi:hypothetical protein
VNPVPRLRAPQEDRAVVAEPPLAQAAELIRENRRRLTLPDRDILGRPWNDLRRQAQRTALAAAEEYLRAAGTPLRAGNPDSLVMAGHQPELFHPGVWVKNFALQGIAQAHNATALNLVVDNDTVKSSAIRVPVVRIPPPPLSEFEPHLAIVPFDHWTSETPYEERAVKDEALFASFPERVRQDWNFTPLLESFWPLVLEEAKRTNLLGERIAAGRRILERRWGCANLEVPVSSLCRTEPFAWFACHLLIELQEFHTVYNTSVHEYRRQYGIRNRFHPVPDLAVEGDWWEVPFWAWRTGQARRQRLFARVTMDHVELRAGEELWPALPHGAALFKAWQELERRGFKVRSRALTNTLYARLFLCDLFLHGIGGGKYDELTDAIIRRFYGLEPPRYLVLSATLLLPLPAYPARTEQHHRLAREVRDLHYNPQQHLRDGALSDTHLRELLQRKRTWMEEQPVEPAERRLRFEVLRELNDRLRPYLADQARRVRQELEEVERELRANAVLRRRDYAFCLYTEELLRPFCTQFLAG